MLNMAAGAFLHHMKGLFSEKVRMTVLWHLKTWEEWLAHQERKRLAMWSRSPPSPPAQCLPGEGRVRGVGQEGHSTARGCLHPGGTVLRGIDGSSLNARTESGQHIQHLSQGQDHVKVVCTSFPSHSLFFLSLLCH